MIRDTVLIGLMAYLRNRGIELKNDEDPLQRAFILALRGEIKEEWILKALLKRIELTKGSKRLLKFFIPYGFDLAVVYTGFCLSFKSPLAMCNPFPFPMAKVRKYYKLKLFHSCTEFYKDVIVRNYREIEDLFVKGIHLRLSCSKRKGVIEKRWKDLTNNINSHLSL